MFLVACCLNGRSTGYKIHIATNSETQCDLYTVWIMSSSLLVDHNFSLESIHINTAFSVCEVSSQSMFMPIFPTYIQHTVPKTFESSLSRGSLWLQTMLSLMSSIVFTLWNQATPPALQSHLALPVHLSALLQEVVSQPEAHIFPGRENIFKFETFRSEDYKGNPYGKQLWGGGGMNH